MLTSKLIIRSLGLGLAFFIASCTSEIPAPTAAPITSSLQETPISIDGVDPTEQTAPIPEVSTQEPEDPYVLERQILVEQSIIGRQITDAAVVKAMLTVPRHEFVPEEYLTYAYEDHPLPIGYGQTISQPYIVALMTKWAEVEPGDNVLEIGTGSGYQAAVLAELANLVNSIEIIEALADRANETLDRLGYDNVTVHHADGYYGLEEQAPFDIIVVTAAPDHVPQPLVQQLAIGGRMIIPVGPVGGFQTLWLVTKVGDDEVQTRNLGGVTFVPFTREER